MRSVRVAKSTTARKGWPVTPGHLGVVCGRRRPPPARWSPLCTRTRPAPRGVGSHVTRRTGPLSSFVRTRARASVRIERSTSRSSARAVGAARCRVAVTALGGLLALDLRAPLGREGVRVTVGSALGRVRRQSLRPAARRAAASASAAIPIRRDMLLIVSAGVSDSPRGIEVEGLVREFKEVTAVAGIDLHVAAGQIYGFLGPNGAGKSTTVHMLTTLLPPTRGRATVGGYDVAREGAQVRARDRRRAAGGGARPPADRPRARAAPGDPPGHPARRAQGRAPPSCSSASG